MKFYINLEEVPHNVENEKQALCKVEIEGSLADLTTSIAQLMQKDHGVGQILMQSVLKYMETIKEKQDTLGMLNVIGAINNYTPTSKTKTEMKKMKTDNDVFIEKIWEKATNPKDPDKDGIDE